MKVGLVSDTHDAEEPLAVAARFFAQQRVDLVLHLGDVTQPETLAHLDGLPLQVVRGNNDEHAWPESWQADLDGTTVFATHGHLKPLLQRAIGHVGVALHGHTHQRRHETIGPTLVVNPGALYRAPRKTIALLELPARRVTFFEVGVERVRPC